MAGLAAITLFKVGLTDFPSGMRPVSKAPYLRFECDASVDTGIVRWPEGPASNDHNSNRLLNI